MDRIGGALEAERKRQGLTLRQLASKAGVSASLLCSIEKGRVNPSVATLFELATALGVRPQIFFDTPPEPAAVGAGEMSGSEDGAGEISAAPHAGDSRIVGIARAASDPRPRPEGPPPAIWSLRRASRPTLHLTQGVTWRLLSPQPDDDVEFMEVEYPAGATSGEEMFTHQGRELGYVLEGELTIEVGFERHVLGPGDSIGYESTTPHRISNQGSVPVRAVWINCKRRTR
jgi:transcriptional regulator with XRE-family HTH domain/quercetin dioxygenase-like cupin family protein